jgi:hypothetical protein
VLHEKPTLVAHWRVCAGSVKKMMMLIQVLLEKYTHAALRPAELEV